MGYKTILTIITDPAQVVPTLAIAADLARAEAAHLDVLCIGLDRTQITGFYPGDGVYLLDRHRFCHLQQRQRRAQRPHRLAALVPGQHHPLTPLRRKPRRGRQQNRHLTVKQRCFYQQVCVTVAGFAPWPRQNHQIAEPCPFADQPGDPTLLGRPPFQ